MQNIFGHRGLLLLLLASLLSSCAKQVPDRPETSTRSTVADSSNLEPAETTFSQQAQAVGDGSADMIRVDAARITDEDLVHLDGLEDRLLRLNLSNTTITGAGLKHIARMQRLEQLRLASSQLTDEDLQVLPELTHLKYLHLIGVPITDAGLQPLKQLTGLSSLYLDGTQTTLGGMRELSEALPNVHLHFDGGHHRDDPGADAHDQAAPP